MIAVLLIVTLGSLRKGAARTGLALATGGIHKAHDLRFAVEIKMMALRF